MVESGWSLYRLWRTALGQPGSDDLRGAAEEDRQVRWQSHRRLECNRAAPGPSRPFEAIAGGWLTDRELWGSNQAARESGVHESVVRGPHHDRNLNRYRKPGLGVHP